MNQLHAFAEFIRRQYQVIILAAVVAGLLLGGWTTAPVQIC